MERNKQGFLFVISGPSGTGKGSICEGLVEYYQVALSVSMTTRVPRENEEEGKNYFFVSKEEFEEEIANEGFYEYAEIYGEYYGTPKKPVIAMLEKGFDVILEIDVKGAMQIKEQVPEVVLIFIMPPSPEELRRRIEGRGTETPERIQRRLERADSEIAQVGKYDFCVVNDDLKKAIKEVRMIMKSEAYLESFKSNFDESGFFSPLMRNTVRKAQKLRVGNNQEKIIERYNVGKI